MKVQVKHEDFFLAVRDDPCHCPIANAIHRQTRQVVHVYSDSVYIQRKGRYRLPERAVKFITAFDDGLLTRRRGFTFEMEKL